MKVLIGLLGVNIKCSNTAASQSEKSQFLSKIIGYVYLKNTDLTRI